jgi:hypothetical protein
VSLRARDVEEALQGVGPLSTFSEAAERQREACAKHLNDLAELTGEFAADALLTIVRETPLVTG